MKNARLLSPLFWLVFPQILAAQIEYSTLLIPPALLTDAHAVVRQAETTFRVVKPDEAEVEETFVATILDPAGKFLCTKYIQESRFSKMKSLKGRLFDINGQLVRESKKEDVRDYGGAAEYEFQDSRLKYLEMEYVHYPFTVEFKTKTSIRGFFSIPDFNIQRLGQSVEQARYTLIAPPSFAFKWKNLHTEVQPKKNSEGAYQMWTWEVKNLPARPDEPFNPFWSNQCAAVLFAPETVEIDGFSGNFSDWHSVGQFFYDLNKGRDLLSPALQAELRQMTEGKSEREKIAILYKSMQASCRYVSIQLGIGGWQTFEAAFVEQKKYGDCKALSNYMKSLLATVGIPAYQALVYAGDEGAPNIQDDLPAPKFNHVILYVPSEDLWLECTSRENPVGYLGEFTADRHVLLLTPEGGKIARTPALSALENFKITRTDIALQENGKAVVQNNTRCGGDRHEYYRMVLGQKAKPEVEKDFLENAGFAIAQLHTLQISPSAEKPEAYIDYHLEINNFATSSGKRLFVPLLKTNPLRRSLPANEKRKLDLQMRDHYTLRDTVVIHFPAGYEAESVPAPKKLESEFGIFEMQVEKAAGQATVIRHVEIKPVAVAAARYAEVRQFLLDASKADAAQMVLVKKM